MSSTSPRTLAALLAVTCLAAVPARAGAAVSVDAESESIIVVAGSVDPFNIAGSATLVEDEELRIFDYGDVNRVLRQVPGVNLQEEDGFGLFPNIGLRGTTVERSENITLMEDGILIAPAPYAAPAAYYFPSVGRMEAVEIAKGAAAVRYGPRTIGGAVNFRSTPVPDDPVSGFLSGQYGEDDHYALHGWVGGDTRHVGALVETWQQGSDGFKHIDGGGDTGFEREDYVAKLAIHSAPDAATQARLEFKYARADTEADETYLGLEDSDFDADPYRRYAASQEDRFESLHEQYLLTGAIEADGATIGLKAYWNDFARNWSKLQSVDFGDGRGFISPQTVFDDPENPLNAAALAILRGQADTPTGGIRIRNNNRVYDSRGIELSLARPFALGASEHHFEIAVRYHEDEEDRLQNEELYSQVGLDLVFEGAEPIGSQANREAKADALAVYVEDRIEIGALTLTPGLRYEAIELRRLDYSKSDADRSEGPTRVRETDFDEWLPAFGATYRLTPEVLVLASVSRGFSPPGPGNPDARAEKSWNYEAGARYRSNDWQAAAIGFYNDYSNILGNCTNAVGCTIGDIGDQFNGGEVDVMGLELSGSGAIAFAGEWHVPLQVSYTYTSAEFGQTFDSDFFGDVEDGDELPYIPEHQLYAEIGIATDRASLTLGANYVSEVRTEAGSGPIPALERIDDRWVFDLAGRFAVSETIGLFGRVDNLFDNEYAVARRPLGLRPGKPQSFIGGVELRF